MASWVAALRDLGVRIEYDWHLGVYCVSDSGVFNLAAVKANGGVGTVSDAYVVVKHPCCRKALGHILFGARFKILGGRTVCVFCKEPHPNVKGARALISDDRWLWPLAWLKKIPPLDEEDEIIREFEESL